MFQARLKQFTFICFEIFLRLSDPQIFGAAHVDPKPSQSTGRGAAIFTFYPHKNFAQPMFKDFYLEFVTIS